MTLNHADCKTCGKPCRPRHDRIPQFCNRYCVRGINQGEKNGMWKNNGGITVTNRGYRKMRVREHPRADRDGYVLEHILVAEKGLGRQLRDGEVVHHINGDKLDNRIENLLIFASHGDHMRYGHRRGEYKPCMTCGVLTYSKRSRVRKYVFCSQKCINPRLWSAV